MCTTDDEVCKLRNVFCKTKYIIFKIKILTVLLLYRLFGKFIFLFCGGPNITLQKVLISSIKVF